MADVLAALEPREQHVILARIAGQSFGEIAPTILGGCGQKGRGRPVTRQCVQQIEARALRKLGSPYHSLQLSFVGPEREEGRADFAEVAQPDYRPRLRFKARAALELAQAEREYDAAVDAALNGGSWERATGLASTLLGR